MTVQGPGLKVNARPMTGAYDRVTSCTPKRCNGPAVSSNIRVVVRVRPENKTEREGNYGKVVQVLDEHMLVFDPKQDEVPEFYHGKQRRTRDLNRRKSRDIQFVFDQVFDEHSTNHEVYENTTKGILDGVLDGYNCSVFAYGATGAGKTFTMKGTLESPGIMFHTMMELYRSIDELREQKTCDVAISYLEVYNEQIRDLLMPGAYLPVREDPNRGCIVSGLSLHKPRDAKHLLHMLEFGNENRTQHPTDANAESSRSHAVFQVFVRQKDRTAGISTDVRVAKMSLIDLAGSERATVTQNRGERFREGANINRSLLALGNCINALAEGKGKGYIPYRNSKLTRLLKDSLGGNCRTVMIAAVSPSCMTYEDTHNTLKYANRAKNIKANLKRNVLSVDFHVSKYAKICDELRGEVAELRAKLESYEDGSVVPCAGKSIANFPLSIETEKLQNDLYTVFYERLNVRKELCELEGLERDLVFRISRKETCMSRLSFFSNEPQCRERLSRNIEAMQARKDKVLERKVALQSRMDDNVNCLQDVEQHMQGMAKDSALPEVLELGVRTHHLEVELRDTKRHVKQLQKLCRAQQKQAMLTERLLTSLLQGFKKQHFILKGSGILTSDLESHFLSIKADLEGGAREVAWADQSMHEHEGGGADAVEGGVKENGGFDRLLDFPVLSLVNTTPKTPVAMSKSRRRINNMAATPDNTHSPFTPGIAASGRRNQSATLQLTPSHCQPKLSGSYQLLNSSNQNVTPYLTPRKLDVTDAVTDDGSLDGDSEVFGGATVTLTSNQTCGLNVPVVEQNTITNHERLHSGVKHSANSQDDSCVKTGQRNIATVAGSTAPHNSLECLNSTQSILKGCSDCKKSSIPLKSSSALNETFNLIDGVQPLEPTPNKPITSHSHIDLSQAVKHEQRSVQSQSSLQTSCTNGDQLHRNRAASESENVAQQNRTVSSSTVTKLKPNVPKGILKSTVTKNKNGVRNGSGSVTICGDADIARDELRRIKRSMDFNDLPSPAGKLTFAEVVKSPTNQQTTISPAAPSQPTVNGRSPLASRENLPPFPTELFDNNPRRTTFAANELDHLQSNSDVRRQTMCSSGTAGAGGKKVNIRTVQNVKRFGLPSVQEATASHVPNYMRPTTAFTNHRNNKLNKANEENRLPSTGARRVPVDSSTVTKKPSRLVQRSKSMSNLHTSSARRGVIF